MNRYLALIIAVLSGAEMQAFQLAPRLVVNITIDQLRTDYLEAFTPLYTADGFRKLLSQGVTYEAASYPTSPSTARRPSPPSPREPLLTITAFSVPDGSTVAPCDPSSVSTTRNTMLLLISSPPLPSATN